jgi:hypothetical protein
VFGEEVLAEQHLDRLLACGDLREKIIDRRHTTTAFCAGGAVMKNATVNV